MKNSLLALLCLPFLAISQTEKGATPLPSTDNRPPSTVTRAVVIGISDYQDAAIPDLRFADRDAEAFANYLRSPAGGSLDGDHLKLLTNQDATTAQFDAALGWLMDESKEGDQAIIYFSGHGDVETKTRSQQGFLLCWDSPPQAYVSGAYPIFFLKEVVSTLSLENKARVIVITDACRSGKLAGNAVGGSQLTSQNLAQQFSNEIKILSCQPNEYSIEGEQWGGGRGAFSFHLVDALYGMADSNSDASVNLMEIGRYLEDKVTTEVAPQSQVPMTVGNRTEKLAAVFPEMLAQVRKNKAGQLPTFSPTDSRGIEEDVLATVDTTVREVYRLFKQALKDKVFLEPTGACADAYYERLIAEPKMERLHNAMRRNYAAALQDGAQQVLNEMLRTGLTEEVVSGKKSVNIYMDYPLWLDRAASLLGKKHYMYVMLQARKAFFEGKIKEKRVEARKSFQTALRWQSDLPHAFVELISTCTKSEVDSAEVFAQKAMELVPGWVVPYVRLSHFYQLQVGDLQKAGELLEAASSVDSISALVFYAKGSLFKFRKDYELAISWYRKAVMSSDSVCFNRALQSLGDTYIILRKYKEAEEVLLNAVQQDSTYGGTLNRLGKVYWLTQRFEEAIEAFKKEIRLSPNDADKVMAYNELGNVSLMMKQLPEAEEYYLKAMEMDSMNFNPYYNLAYVYSETNRVEQAVNYYYKCFQIDSTIGAAYVQLEYVIMKTEPNKAIYYAKKGVQLEPTPDTYFTLACIMAVANQLDEAFEALEKSHYDYDWIQQDADLAPLRAQKERWQALMKKNYPDQTKD